LNHGIFSSNAILLMKPSFCFPRLDVRFMVEVVMLPVLAHYAVCWSGHPTRLAEILRVHSGLFRFLLPDATWGNGLGLREWTPFRLTYRISRYIYTYMYIYIYIYTRMPEATQTAISICVWCDQIADSPPFPKVISRQIERHQPPMEKHLKDLVQNNLKRNTKSLNPFQDPPIWGFSSCCCMVAFESTCNTASAGGWEGMGRKHPLEIM